MIRKAGDILYTLTFKNVKNINLRVKNDLSITVSAHKFTSLKQIDDFVLQKSDWIKRVQKKIESKKADFNSDTYKNADCLKIFNQISDKIYEEFAHVLKEKPEIKVRLMKSCWGVCHPKKNYITLNKMLLDKPIEAIEYVIMHEYVHYIHFNHQKGFYNELKKHMPDYKERRKLLK